MKIDCVTSGQQAIDVIRAEKVHYNAVFMDHMMPGMDGIEATRIIREEIGTEYAKTVPIIALTANAMVGNEEMFLGRGFQAYISKPIEIDRLDSVILEWVRDKELEDTMGQIYADGHLLPDVRIGDVRGETDRHAAVSERRDGTGRRTLDRKVTGLDVDKGLERFGGDEESYLNVLRSFVVNTPSLIESARMVTREKLHGYAVSVHGLKGSCRGICAEPAGAKAEALEKAAKAGDFDFVTANNAGLMEAAEKLTDDIKSMLEKMPQESPKPVKDKPEEEALSRLVAACDSYDINGVETAMAEIEAYQYEGDDGLTLWLRENVDQMNFSEIKEKLSAFAR
jgi:CheY-like chemotaxis protein